MLTVIPRHSSKFRAWVVRNSPVTTDILSRIMNKSLMEQLAVQVNAWQQLMVWLISHRWKMARFSWMKSMSYQWMIIINKNNIWQRSKYKNNPAVQVLWNYIKSMQQAWIDKQNRYHRKVAVRTISVPIRFMDLQSKLNPKTNSFIFGKSKKIWVT